MEKEVVWASLVSEANLLEWIGKLKGPVGTPYEGASADHRCHHRYRYTHTPTHAGERGRQT